MSASSTWLPPRAPWTRSVSSACVALRFGRKPYDERAEVGLEDRLQHDRRRHLRDPIPHRGNAERPLPAIGLRDVSPQNRLRSIRACAQRGVGARRACAPRRTARRDRASRDRRPPRRGSPSPAAMPPAGRHACRSDPVGHGSGAPGIAWLRPRVDVAIGARCRSADAHRGNWDRTCRPCPRASLRPRPDHRRGPSLPSRYSSRRSAVLRPPRTPAAPRSLSPSAYTSRAALTRAAQTGLSCSVPLRARVLRPIPRRDLPRVHLRTGDAADMAFAAT